MALKRVPLDEFEGVYLWLFYELRHVPNDNIKGWVWVYDIVRDRRWH